MPEHDALVQAYSHLADFPRASEALTTLKKVASLVKPIMRARGWRVRELAEFFPDQHNLLGLNVNRGQRILLRLRHPGDRAQFVLIEQVIDTMLHELSHIVHGPHDGKFHALWNQLRDEHMGLVMKGYTGEGFLSDGHRLGGSGRKPMYEARRLARAAAERRRARGALTGSGSGSGRRLGGDAPRPGRDIRRTIAGAAEQRNTTLQGCGNMNHNEREIQALSETATRNGFRTQAEEDAANEAAIAQALWELVQEEEKQKYGNYYVPPSAQHPEGSQGGAVMLDHGRPLPPPITPEIRPPSSGLVFQSRTSSQTSSYQPPTTQKGWTCGLCTFHNPATFLACEACGTERGEDTSRAAWTPNEEKRRTVSSMSATASASASSAPNESTSAVTPTIDLTDSPPPKAKANRALPAQAASATSTVMSKPQTWQCSFCGTMMKREWWTCWTCGLMKDNSR